MTVNHRFVKDTELTVVITDIKTNGGYILAMAPSKMNKEPRKTEMTVTEYVVVYRT